MLRLPRSRLRVPPVTVSGTPSIKAASVASSGSKATRSSKSSLSRNSLLHHRRLLHESPSSSISVASLRHALVSVVLCSPRGRRDRASPSRLLIEKLSCTSRLLLAVIGSPGRGIRLHRHRNQPCRRRRDLQPREARDNGGFFNFARQVPELLLIFRSTQDFVNCRNFLYFENINIRA